MIAELARSNSFRSGTLISDHALILAPHSSQLHLNSTMFCVAPARLLSPACTAQARRSFFSFSSPFGDSAPAKPTNPNSKLRKRGSINIYSEEKVFE